MAVNGFPGLAQIVADDDAAQWVAPGAPVPDGPHWERSEIAPVPGTERLVIVSTYKRDIAPIGGERWMLFRPGDSAVNGWDDHLEAIPASAFVRCRVLAAMPDGADPHRRWLRVAILDTIPFPKLERRFVALGRLELETWRLSTGGLTRWQDGDLWFAPHDDAGCWSLARLDGDLAHVVAAGEWVYGAGMAYDRAWGGHVVIPLTEWRRRICSTGCGDEG